MDTDSFVLSVNTKDIIKDFKTLEELFDFCNLSGNHEIFSNKNQKGNGKFKIETPKIFSINEFIWLRSKMYTLKCVDDSNKKLKGVSKSHSKNIKFDEYKKRLDGGEYQKECDIYIIRSLNQDMYLQLVQKSTLSQFDDER